MSETDFQIALLRDPRIALHALAPTPLWLWRIDGSRILWANPAGVAYFRAASSQALAERAFDKQSIAAQIARVASMLNYSSPARLERLRGLGARIGQPLTCICSRVSFPDLGPAVLVVAAEPVGRSLSEDQRLQLLLADVAMPAAAFSRTGNLRTATPEAANRLNGATSLGELGAAALGEEAQLKGRAYGATQAGMLYLDRIGTGDNCVLLLTFGAEPETPIVRSHVEAQQREAAVPTPHIDSAPNQTESDLDHTEADVERRYPLRFIWQTDANGRFTLGTSEFSDVIGPRVASALGRPWSDIASELGLDPNGEVAAAMGTHNTWSGITVPWPAEGLNEPLPIELSGLPVYDSARGFEGYRGFGVCRDLSRLTQLAKSRRFVTGSVAEALEEPAESTGSIVLPSPNDAPPAAENVVPFPIPESRVPALTQGEHHAFHELARQLSDRLLDAERAARDAQGNLFAETATEAEIAANDDQGQTSFEAVPNEAPVGVDHQHALSTHSEALPVLDHLPMGLLISQHDQLVYANNAFLAWSGFTTLGDLRRAGGLDALHTEPGGNLHDDGGQTLILVSHRADERRAPGRLFILPWNGQEAHALVLLPEPAPATDDLARWRRTEQDLIEARAEAEKASAAKSAFLAKISHEVRTPMNAIIGFSELMLAERFGPVGNERYLAYLKDIHASGEHMVSLLNDLLDLSKIEAGKMELNFTSLGLNDLMQQCVAIMQPQANRGQVIIRTSLSPKLPLIMADARSVRQIVLNLLSNSIKFTDAGGQVIVSSALNDNGQVVMRVRDTGAGMSEQDIVTAMEPFRQLTTSAKWGSNGTGLGLPLTKALAEANHAAFSIKSAANTGTLVEVTFQADKIPAE